LVAKLIIALFTKAETRKGSKTMPRRAQPVSDGSEGLLSGEESDIALSPLDLVYYIESMNREDGAVLGGKTSMCT
jgi:hypothetical protein